MSNLVYFEGFLLFKLTVAKKNKNKFSEVIWE